MGLNLLNERFGGPVFLFSVMTTAVYIAAAYLTENHGIFDFRSGFDEIFREDFVAFYRAGMLAQNGQAALAYNPEFFAKPFSEGNKNLLFLNPPHAFLFFEPLAYFSYPVARGMGLLTNLAAIYGIVRIADLNLGPGPYILTLLTYSCLWSFTLLQISPIIIFLVVYALVYGQRQPVLSGIALSLATLKPQFGLLVPVFLLAQKDWRTFFVAGFATTALVGLSIFKYGLPVWEVFLSSAMGGSHASHLNQVYSGMITVSHSLGKLSVADEDRTLAQILAVLVCGGWVLYVGRTLGRQAAVPVVIMAMCAASPSSFFYDWLMLCSGMLLFLKYNPAWPVHLQITAGILWTAPLLRVFLIGTGQSEVRIELARYLSASLPLLMMCVSLQMYLIARKKPKPEPLPKEEAVVRQLA